MWRFLAAGLVASYALSSLADEPRANTTKPPYERLLKGADAKRAKDLSKRIAEREQADDYAEAIKAAEELWALRVQVQGADHHETTDQQHLLVSLHKVSALGRAKREGWRSAIGKVRETGRLEAKASYAQALAVLQNILDWRRDVLGELHPDTATSYHRVAENLADQGQAAAAGPLYRKALAIRRQILGEEHPDTATSCSSLGANLSAQGKTAEAGLLLQKALDIRRRVRGEEHPDTATSYNNLAVNLNVQGKVTQAEPLYQKALDIQRRVLGEEHLNTAKGYSNLAVNLNAQGKAAEAGPLYQKVLDIRRRALGEEHPDTAISYNNLATNLSIQG